MAAWLIGGVVNHAWSVSKVTIGVLGVDKALLTARPESTSDPFSSSLFLALRFYISCCFQNSRIIFILIDILV